MQGTCLKLFLQPICLFIDPKSSAAQATDNGVAGNLYAIKWSPAGRGFVLGNDAILLRHL